MSRAQTAERILDMAEAIRPGSKLIVAFEKDRIRLERLFIPELMKEFRALGSHVANAAEGQGGLLIEASRDERSRIASILNAAGLKRWAQAHMKPLFQRQWRRVMDSTVLTLTRLDVPVTLRNELAQDLLDMGGRRIGLLDIEEDTKRSLFHVLEEGREQGLNPRDTAKLIEEKVPAGRFVNAGPSYRAELIARTETVEAQRQSSLKMYKDSPVIKKVVAFDGDTDEHCAGRNGVEFTFGDAELESASTHPNCVLSWAPIV
jgi:SPP1 gp7 family putative phage head morphogenesis protein